MGGGFFFFLLILGACCKEGSLKKLCPHSRFIQEVQQEMTESIREIYSPYCSLIVSPRPPALHHVSVCARMNAHAQMKRQRGKNILSLSV